MSHILVPLDGSAHSAAVLAHAALLAHTLHAGVTLISVVPPVPAADYWPAPASPLVRQRWQDDAITHMRAYLQTAAQNLEADGIPVAYDVPVADDVAAEIVRRAQPPDVHLIAMTTHGRSGWREWLFGSVAQKVLHGASVPLLVVRAPDSTHTAAPPTLRTIVVPLDGSVFAEQALPLARELAQASGATLLLLAAVPPLDNVGLAMSGVEPLWVLPDNHDVIERQRAYLNEWAHRLRAEGLNVRTQCVCDTPADAITHTARAEGADLIVMTTHGRTGAQRVWLGSVAHKVVHCATAPVLLVRAHNSKTPKEETP